MGVIGAFEVLDNRYLFIRLEKKYYVVVAGSVILNTLWIKMMGKLGNKNKKLM